MATSSLSLTLAACSPSNTSASDSETVAPQEASTATQMVQKAEVVPITTPQAPSQRYSKTSLQPSIKIQTVAAVKNG